MKLHWHKAHIHCILSRNISENYEGLKVNQKHFTSYCNKSES